MKFESYSQMFLLITAQFSQINIENIEKLLDNVLKIHLYYWKKISIINHMLNAQNLYLIKKYHYISLYFSRRAQLKFIDLGPIWLSHEASDEDGNI